MAMKSVRCPVLGANVTEVTDFEGTVTQVICAEFDSSNGMCRLKKAAFDGGPLAQLMARLSEDTLSTHSTKCVFYAA
jgi:hypothetical protein